MNLARNLFLGFALLMSWTIAHGGCEGEESGSFAVSIDHFTTDAPAIPSSIGFQLADLQGTGELELIEGGGRYASGDNPGHPTIAVVQARKRQGDLAFATRASLAFPGEVLLAVGPLPAEPSGTRVAVVTRSTSSPEARVRMVDGATWTAGCYASVGHDYVAAALDVAENRLYLQALDRMDVFSLPDLAPLATFGLAGGDHFALAQLDDDPAPEIIVGGTPGLVVDSETGGIEWTYEPGFPGPIVVGNFGIDAHQGFVTWGATSVDVFSGAPYGVHGSLMPLSFQTTNLAYTAHDVDGNGRDEVVLAVVYPSGSQSIYSVRTFDADTLQVTTEDMYPRDRSAIGIGAIDGRVAGTIEMIDDLDNGTLRVHALGSMSQTWTETAGAAAFAVDSGRFDGVPSIAYGDGEVHILRADDWSEVTRTPLVFNDPIIPFAVRDLAVIDSAFAGEASLVLGGSRFFGAMERLAATPWSIDWNFGIANDPQGTPFNGAVHRVVAYDATGDGEEDVVVAAHGSSFDNPGAIVSLVDGADGHVIWLRDRLGGEYAAINNLVSSERSGAPRLLAAGTEASYVFDAADGTQAWTHPFAAVAASPIGDSGGFAFAGTDGSIEAYDVAGQSLWSSHVRAPISAMNQVTADSPVLVVAASRLRWLDPSNGAQIGVSRPIVPGLAMGNRWSVTRADAESVVHVVATSEAGLYGLSVALPPNDEIFYDGYE